MTVIYHGHAITVPSTALLAAWIVGALAEIGGIAWWSHHRRVKHRSVSRGTPDDDA